MSDVEGQRTVCPCALGRELGTLMRRVSCKGQGTYIILKGMTNLYTEVQAASRPVSSFVPLALYVAVAVPALNTPYQGRLSAWHNIHPSSWSGNNAVIIIYIWW